MWNRVFQLYWLRLSQNIWDKQLYVREEQRLPYLRWFLFWKLHIHRNQNVEMHEFLHFSKLLLSFQNQFFLWHLTVQVGLCEFNVWLRRLWCSSQILHRWFLFLLNWRCQTKVCKLLHHENNAQLIRYSDASWVIWRCWLLLSIKCENVW
jgi:hypothetical protein